MGVDPSVACQDVPRPRVDISTQRRVINRNHRRIYNFLDIEAIYSYLNQEGLLTDHEKEILLNPYHTSFYKKDRLVEWIPTKGSDGLDRFIRCLRNSSSEARGHGELADMLQNNRNNPVPNCWWWIPTPYSTWIKDKLIQMSLSILFLILACLLPLLYQSQLLDLLSGPSSPQESISLPPPCGPFLGRDREISVLLSELDFKNDEVGVVSVFGATGIGKSCLAVYVAHTLTEDGVPVSYFDASLLPLDSLPDLILQTTGSPHNNRSISSTERLVHWLRRDMKQPLLVVLDNYDNIFTEKQRVEHYLNMLFDNSAMSMKVLITTTTETSVTLSKPVFKYQLEQVSFDSACEILRSISERELSTRNCELITGQIGRSPQSLVLIGNILKSTTMTVKKVVSDMKSEIAAIEPGEGTETDVAISLSLKNLKHHLVEFAAYLALFPGSFTVTQACSILSPIINIDCNWIDTLRQTGLLTATTGGHYYFRNSIRKHLILYRENNGIEEGLFLKEFVSHVSKLLQDWSKSFKSNNLVLDKLERHELRLFIANSIDNLRKCPTTKCLTLLHSTKLSIEEKFLFSVNNEDQLVNLLQHALSAITSIIDMEELSTSTPDLAELYIYFTLKSIDIKPPRNVVAVLEKARQWLSRHANSTYSLSIKTLYSRLCRHYSESRKLKKELSCHIQLLKYEGRASECESNIYSYKQLAEMYYSQGELEWSIHFQKLYIISMELTHMELTEAYLQLHAYQVNNLTVAISTAENILDMYENIELENNTLLRLVSLYSNVSFIFHQHKWKEQANRAEEKMISTVQRLDFSNHTVRNLACKTMFSLVEYLSAAKEYESVAKIVRGAVDMYYYSQGDANVNRTRKIAVLHRVLGKAELHNGQRRESIDSFKIVIASYYNDSELFNYAREACNAMLIQTHTELACFYIALIEALTIVHSIASFITSETIDTELFPYHHIYEFQVLVPGELLTDNIADIPVGPYCIVFFFKWCLANILYLLSFRFLVHIVNLVFVMLKLVLVVCAPSFTLFIMYATVNFVKRVYRVLWNSVWSDEM